MKIRIKRYDLLMGIALFIIIGYIFNMSWIDRILGGSALIYILYGLAAILMLSANIKYIKNSHPHSLRLAITIALLATILFRNVDLAHHQFALPFFTVFAIYAVYILGASNEWHGIAKKILLVFAFEHVIATFFCYIFKDFYISNILPLYPDYRSELLYQFNHSQIAGLTHHYSTNALYLVTGIFTILSAMQGQNKNRRKIYAILLVLNIIALLLTGKRSQIVYLVIVAIICTILKYRKQITKALTKIMIGLVAAAAIVVVLSQLIPSIGNSMQRIYDTVSDSSSMDSRNILYDVAKEEFENNKIFGIGWGGYRYAYHDKVSSALKERSYMQAHCIYLQLLCEVGIIGLILFCAIFLSLLRSTALVYLKNEHINKNISQQALIIFGFISYFLLEGAFGNVIYDKQLFIPFSLFVAMSLGLGSSLRQKARAKLLREGT